MLPSLLESVAELKCPVFQTALTLHDIDSDSAMGTSIVTDDRSSSRFSDDEEVSEFVYIIMLQLAICLSHLNGYLVSR